MTKREIMVRAHEVARTLEGDYRARMSAGLTQAWLESRLVNAGGNRWEKAGHRRLYFNNLEDLYGLELDHYGTGNISSATLNGEKISNNSARELVFELRSGKLWYDLNKGTFDSRGLRTNLTEAIINRLQEAA